MLVKKALLALSYCSILVLAMDDNTEITTTPTSLTIASTVGILMSSPETLSTSTSTVKSIQSSSTTAIAPSPTQPGTISTCDLWYKVKEGDTCDKIVAKYARKGLTLAEFYEWNPDVGPTCANLWLGYYVCVNAPSDIILCSTETTPPSTAPATTESTSTTSVPAKTTTYTSPTCPPSATC